MSKRRADASSSLAASAKLPTRTRIVFLAKEPTGMQQSDFIIETNESDFFRWTIHMSETVMHDELKQDVHRWARRYNKDPLVTLEVVCRERECRPRAHPHAGTAIPRKDT